MPAGQCAGCNCNRSSALQPELNIPVSVRAGSVMPAPRQEISLENKIEKSTKRAESLTSRLKCLSWTLMAFGGITMLSGLRSLGFAREWSHFIVVSRGKLPWTTGPEHYYEIMKNATDAAPTEAEFDLYQIMLFTSFAVVGLGLYLCMQS
mgnify:CR=1 FL=1|jgi:hypothetical protein